MMKQSKKRRWLLLGLGLLLAVLGWQLVLDQHREEEKRLRTELRQSLAQQFPEQATRAQQRYGLQAWRAGAVQWHRPQVVLIHGLDDPGKVWMNLAPALDSAGFSVWIMLYPNDQPIVESARLLAGQLESLKTQGAGRVDLVAHSMGGLVARAMLTEPALEGGDGPRVSQLIMVGTPNHGSELARFRSLAEWRDQFSDLLEGDFHWLGFIFDGAGEAGIDLLPGSRFLRELNARPGPRSTRLTVIAAELSKYDRERVSGLVEEESALVEAQALLAEVSASVGDGLVSVASARLDGADFHLVEGNHMSMIRNVLESSQRVPPAVPLVVRLLQNPDQTVTSIP